jgi:hypothetical protein
MQFTYSVLCGSERFANLHLRHKIQSVRLITRNELPETGLWIKHPGTSRWHPTEIDQDNLNTVAMHAQFQHGMFYDATIEEAVERGWLWSTKPDDEVGARRFVVDEENDGELRQRARDCGDKPYTIVLNDGRRISCCNFPTPVPFIITGIRDDTIFLDVAIDGRFTEFRWYNIADIMG